LRIAAVFARPRALLGEHYNERLNPFPDSIMLSVVETDTTVEEIAAGD
jgi:hypothetical protein